MNTLIDNLFSTSEYKYKTRTFKSSAKDNGDHFSAEIELAGYDKSEIKINATDESLKINAKNEKRSKDLIIYLDNLISIDSIKVDYKNGLLSIVLPKKSAKDSVEIKLN